MYEIEHTANPNPSDIDFLRNKLIEKDSSCASDENISQIGFFIKKDKNEIIAGAICFISYKVINIMLLWVNEKYRKQGIATKLINAAHDLAKKKNCKMAVLETMNFENAEIFYKKLGYIRDFKRDGYVDGKYCIYMSKQL